MEKAKKFIEDYTRRFSNAIAQSGKGMWDSGGFEVVYQPWLTPDDALSAVEIAKEEVIEESAEWMKLYILNHDIIDIFEMETEYKKYMEG